MFFSTKHTSLVIQSVNNVVKSFITRALVNKSHETRRNLLTWLGRFKLAPLITFIETRLCLGEKLCRNKT
jgi:hypothetical protein